MSSSLMNSEALNPGDLIRWSDPEDGTEYVGFLASFYLQHEPAELGALVVLKSGGDFKYANCVEANGTPHSRVPADLVHPR